MAYLSIQSDLLEKGPSVLQHLDPMCSLFINTPGCSHVTCLARAEWLTCALTACCSINQTVSTTPLIIVNTQVSILAYLYKKTFLFEINDL